jgi:hypothetical protein
VILSFVLPRFKNKKWIPILIDPSFVKNKFLGVLTKTKRDQVKAEKGFFLLSAALPVEGRAISFFQCCWRNSHISYRVYNSFNQLMRMQFIKILKLLDSVKDKTVFVIDRGFGYDYFFTTCKELNAHFVIRVRDLKTHIIKVRGKKEMSISELVTSVLSAGPVIYHVKYKGYLDINLVIVKKGKSVWVIATDLDDPQEVVKLYRQRMKIEETFKDWKKTGFDIERLQIRQWDLLPKMIWCVVIAHLILYLLGETISRSKHYKNIFKKFIQIKKNLSFVQLAWKASRFAFNDIIPLFSYLKNALLTTKGASL